MDDTPVWQIYGLPNPGQAQGGGAIIPPINDMSNPQAITKYAWTDKGDHPIMNHPILNKIMDFFGKKDDDSSVKENSEANSNNGGSAAANRDVAANKKAVDDAYSSSGDSGGD